MYDYDWVNIGSPFIVFAGGIGGIAYALHSLVVHHPKLYGTEASE